MTGPPKKDATPRLGQVNGASVEDQSPECTPPVPEGVTAEAWKAIGATPEGTSWIIPERNATGEVIGRAIRRPDGSKDFKAGGHRGLILKWPLPAYAGSSDTEPVLICEGASDTAAAISLGFDAVGVPMAGHCGAMLAELLAGLRVVPLGDSDDAGRRGAEKLAGELAGRVASLRIIYPPAGTKDLRLWTIAGALRADVLELIGKAEPIQPESAPIDGSPVIVRMSDVKPEPLSWLWPNRIPLGKLVCMAGDPGLGKSLVLLDIAARVSRGTPWPDLPGEPNPAGGVVLLSAEDDPNDTIRPRLDAAGADCSRITLVKGVRAGVRGVRSFTLEDVPALEQAIRATPDCRCVGIDPVTAYLGRIDAHRNDEVRGLLAPLADLGTRLGVPIVFITHLNKSVGGKGMYRMTGSLALPAAARAAWLFAKAKDDPRARLMLPAKMNLCAEPTGLAYTVTDGPCIAWSPDPIAMTADDALAAEAADGGDHGASSARDEAVDWLRDVLSGGPTPAKDVKTAAERDGIKPRTLDRAKAAAGVVATREGYASDGRWVWALPHSAPPDPLQRQPLRVALNGELGAQSTRPDTGRENHP